MTARLVAPEPWRAALEEYARREKLSLEIAAEGEGAVRVLPPEERRACGPEALVVKGRIPCGVARAMAGRLGIPMNRMAGLLNLLEIKVRECELGCF